MHSRSHAIALIGAASGMGFCLFSLLIMAMRMSGLDRGLWWGLNFPRFMAMCWTLWCGLAVHALITRALLRPRRSAHVTVAIGTWVVATAVAVGSYLWIATRSL